ncbi:hypothetical protein JMUB5695_03113 [Mycobacterium heckeshornense]|uniref:DUF2742 domain-containing protein n=1 Tax=Mycobacterium heckeshornense TaxID=110505 RepID=UPI00194068C3|nr:DUF2742 domain-containing protein [Mycobacterium heckeshornense]BCQ09663.1 hypothetical protein JMUB5695_03113 [Mycobacterium heckeshornense]
MTATRLGSRQVSWWPVHEFVRPWLERAGDWPPAGTAAWQQLSATDPRKWAALLDAARHWCLRLDTLQAELAEASKSIAATTDWRAVAAEITKLRAAEATGARILRKVS